MTIQAFNDIDLHEVLVSAVNSMPDFGTDTKFSDVQAFSDLLSSNITKIGTIQVSLNDVFREAPTINLRTHIKSAYDYLSQVRSACLSMREAISSGDIDEMNVARQAIMALKSKASDLNETTEELMRKNGISGEEGKYR